MAEKKRVVYYMNQFFGQIGGEDKADVGVTELPKPVGPAMLANQLLGEHGEVVATVICGDNYFNENMAAASREICSLFADYSPDLIFAGPAFSAGRYGLACGEVCKTVKKELNIPAITAMNEENPGVELYRKDIMIVKTGNTARQMKEAVSKMVELGGKLLNKEDLQLPDEEGYFSQGIKKNIYSARTAAERAGLMLVAKLKGLPFTTEVRPPQFEHVVPAPPVKNMVEATVALVTDGGLFPRGNPDKIEALKATRYGKYDISGLDKLQAGDYEVSHIGYDKTYVEEDPNRLVPLDAARDLEKEGKFRVLLPYYYATAGAWTSLDTVKTMGQEMAAELWQAGVDGIILTST